MIHISLLPKKIKTNTLMNYYYHLSGDVIQTMLGTTSDIPGRTKQTFVVGHGLTNEGVRLLGQKLANMTIGHMENLLDIKNVDPIEVLKLIDQLRDLFKALVRFIEKE